MKLRLATIDLKPGDIVLANGDWRDKTVVYIEEQQGECVIVHWSCGGKTRYHFLFEHNVFRQ